MANNYNPKANFEGSAQSTPYQTGQIASIVPHMQAEHRRQEQGFRNYMAGVERNNQTAIAIAKTAGSDAKHLAKLSATLSETFVQMEKRAQQEREIDEQLQGLFGDGKPVGEIIREEQETDQLDHDLAEISAGARVDVENAGGLGTAELFYATPLGSIAPSYASGKQQVAAAQTSYSPFLQGWAASDTRVRVPGFEGTVAQGYASGNPAIISALTRLGRQEFFRQTDLRNASRGEVARYLGTTVPQAEGALNAAAVAAAGKANRTNRQNQIVGQGYTVAQQQPHSTLQDQFTNLSDSLFYSGAAPTRAAANELAVKTLGGALADAGDEEGIRVLLGVQKINGQKGTELNNQYAPILQPLLRQAASNRRSLDRAKADQINRDMYQDLAKAPTAAAKAQRVEQAAKQLEDAGLFEEARELRERQSELQVSGAATRNYSELNSQVQQGLIVDPRVIDEHVLRGEISPAQGQELKNQLGSVYEYNKPTDKLGASVAKSWTDRIQKTYETALGLKRDSTGQIISLQGAVLSAGEADIITDQMGRDINATVNQWLRDNAGLSEQAKLTGLQNHLNEWYKDNVETEGGKYFIDPALRGVKTDKTTFDKSDLQKGLAERSRQLIGKPATFAQPNARTDKPQTFTFYPGTGLSKADAQQFNPVRNDILFNNIDVREWADNFNKDGVINRDLVLAAEQVGMSPLALLQQQLGAYGFTVPLKAPNLQTKADINAPMTAVDGANALMAMGVPSKGAAWLSGNIMQESGWNPNRTPWDDVGAPAGGLVSWRAGRLDRAEASFGQVEQATTGQQLQYMLKEMKENYPNAYRVFMNPYATDRQLMRASSEYWGFGDTGERFSYARDVERQLNRVPQEKRAETVSLMNMPAKQRTIAVGQKIIQEFGLKPWQHPNFDADKGFVAEGGARNWERPYNSYHNHNQALDIPLHPYGGQKLDELYAYLQKNRKALGITELLWRCPNHHDHLHVAFG